MSRVLPALATLVIAGGGATACGGSPSPTPVPHGPTASIVAPRASEADLVVAEVNGRPVWGSCVTQQAAAGARDRRVALEECIGFELLAQAAEQRGFAADSDVQQATRAAMVSRLVATDFEARYQRPSDLGPALDKMLAKNEWRLHRPELRGSTYVRAVVPPDSPPEVDATAKQVADAVVAELETEVGLLPSHLRAAADRAAAATTIEINSQNVQPIPSDAAFEKPYLDALFAIPEVGRISKPARTTRGWDVLLWSGGLSPRESTREQLANEIFPDLRRAQFLAWVAQLSKASGIVVTIVPESIELLGEEPQ